MRLDIQPHSKQLNMFTIRSLLSTTSSLLLLSNFAVSAALPTESTNTKDLLPRDNYYEISVSDYCKWRYGSGAVAKTVGNGCNDWRCVSGGATYGADFNAWCDHTEGDGDCVTYSTCSSGVFSWRCVYVPCT